VEPSSGSSPAVANERSFFLLPVGCRLFRFLIVVANGCLDLIRLSTIAVVESADKMMMMNAAVVFRSARRIAPRYGTAAARSFTSTSPAAADKYDVVVIGE